MNLMKYLANWIPCSFKKHITHFLSFFLGCRIPCNHWTKAAQEWTNRTLAVHERVDSRFLVLPGSESTITEITEYMYFTPLKPRREFKYKSEQNTVPVDLSTEHTVPVDLTIEPFLFL